MLAESPRLNGLHDVLSQVAGTGARGQPKGQAGPLRAIPQKMCSHPTRANLQPIPMNTKARRVHQGKALLHGMALFVLLATAWQAVAQPPNRGRGAAPPLNAQNLASSLGLTADQGARIQPLVEAFNQSEKELSAEVASAQDGQTALRAQLAALFTPEQQKQIIVADLLGTYDDRQNMMAQLGITKLRPGKNGSKQEGPGFDLATANPWKDTLPELLKMKDGTPVTTAAQWPARRREILEDFEREIYGRIPATAPRVTWEVTATTKGDAGGVPTITRQLSGHVDSSRLPGARVIIQASYTLPAQAAGAVPLLVAFGGGGQDHALPHGWGAGTLDPNSIQADAGGMALRQGVIGIANAGQPRKPDDWGALRAWAWGLSRLIDYFEQHPDSGVDPRKIGITGVSRYGKAAIVAHAFDERVAVSLVGSSGQGGVKLHRHDFGEAIENLTGGSYYWMAGHYLKYGSAESSSGKKDAGDLPVDSHQLIALCAPRPCFISYGIESKGDPKWVGAAGSYMAGILASPAYELFGKTGYGVAPADYITAPMPAVGTLIGGELAWRQHDGGHTQEPNFPAFFDWVSRYLTTPGLDK